MSVAEPAHKKTRIDGSKADEAGWMPWPRPDDFFSNVVYELDLPRDHVYMLKRLLNAVRAYARGEFDASIDQYVHRIVRSVLPKTTGAADVLPIRQHTGVLPIKHPSAEVRRLLRQLLLETVAASGVQPGRDYMRNSPSYIFLLGADPTDDYPLLCFMAAHRDITIDIHKAMHVHMPRRAVLEWLKICRYHLQPARVIVADMARMIARYVMETAQDGTVWVPPALEYRFHSQLAPHSYKPVWLGRYGQLSCDGSVPFFTRGRTFKYAEWRYTTTRQGGADAATDS